MRDLEVLAQLREPRRERDGLALEPGRPATPVPLLVGPAERLGDCEGQPQLVAEGTRDGRVVRHHVVHLPAARESELEPHAEAVQRWVPGAEAPHRRRRGARAGGLVVVFARLQRDVVAEPPGLLVGVCMAAHIDEQRGVVDDRPFLLVQPDALGEAQCDQALPQHVLHRLPESEVDAERERGDELRQPNPCAIALARHAPRLSRPLERDKSRSGPRGKPAIRSSVKPDESASAHQQNGDINRGSKS